MQPVSRSLGHRAPLLRVVLPLIAGLVAGRTGLSTPVGWQLAAAVVCIGVAVWSHWRAPRAWPFCLSAALFLAGSSMYAIDRARLAAWERLPPREAVLVIRITRLFAPGDPRRVSGLAVVLSGPTHLGDLNGQRLYFSLSPPPDGTPLIRSAIIATIGVLITLPLDPPDDTFDGYLAAAGINFRLTRGRVLDIKQPPSAYHRFCARAASDFSTILGTGVAEKQPALSGVLRAMLLGQKHELNEHQDTLFMRSGTMHLFAISGLHIGMIAVALHALLRLCRLPRPVCLTVGLGTLWLYVDITGGAPSAVRAFIMVALVETALVMCLPRNPLAALAASALLVVLVWPMQLFSASFQLSYGIVAALVLLGLPLAETWEQRWQWFKDLPVAAWTWRHRVLDAGRRRMLVALGIGVASTLVSSITGIMFFQLFTPAALLANILLIPAAMLVVLAGFASLVCGLLGFITGSILFNHAAVLVLWAIDAVVRAAVATPGAWRAAHFTTPWHGQVALLLLILTLLLGYAADWRRAAGGWWPPFAVVAITLLLAVEFT